MEELKQERIHRYNVVGRIVDYVQQGLTDLLNLDTQKKILAYHGNYSSSELFRELDKD